VRKFVAPAAALALITGISYLGLFQRQTVLAVSRPSELAGGGRTPAPTPREALDRFCEAIQGRDYEAAADCCCGDFAEQMHKAAPAAQNLGLAIDGLRQCMNHWDISSDEVRRILDQIEPFPRRLKVRTIVTKRDEGLAYGQLVGEDGRPMSAGGRCEGLGIDPRWSRSLARSIPNVVVLQRVTEDGETGWKIFVPITPEQRRYVAYLDTHALGCARWLWMLAAGLKRDGAAGSDLERELRRGLAEAGE
jgi:hypothetical protein